MIQLLPCPFCGGPGKIESYVPEGANGPKHPIHFGCCIPCEMRLRGHVEREWAVMDWNRRANRWAAFTPEELRRLRQLTLGCVGVFDLIAEIESELARRQSGEGGGLWDIP
jgi:Restriction alleviation protein Lar